MAFTVIPGVSFKETDLSQYIPQLSSCSVGLVVTASKGVVNQRTFVSSLENYIKLFGLPEETHPGSLVAREYFENKGALAWVIRVTDGTEAAASVSVTCIDGSSKTANISTAGTDGNRMQLSTTHGDQKSGTYSTSLALVNGGNNATKTLPNVPITPGTVVLKDGTTMMAQDDGQGAMVFTDDYPEFAATVNYKTGAVAFTVTGWAGGSVSKTLNFTFGYYSTFGIELGYTTKT